MFTLRLRMIVDGLLTVYNSFSVDLASGEGKLCALLWETNINGNKGRNWS